MQSASPVISSFLAWAQTLLPNPRDMQILVLSYGLDGLSCRSLAEVGAELEPSISREAVRQALVRILGSLLSADSDAMPEIVVKCMREVAAMAPVATTDLAEGLRARGWIGGDITGEAIIKLSTAFAPDELFANLELIRSTGGSFLGSRELGDLIKPVTTAAVKRVSQAGMASVAEVVSAAQLQVLKKVFANPRKLRGGGGGIKRSPSAKSAAAHAEIQAGMLNERSVRAILTAGEDTVWIDEKREYLFFGDDRRNRLIARLRKIFAVVEEAHISDVAKALQRSLTRNHKTASTLPMSPGVDVLHRFIEATSAFKVENGMVSCNMKLSPKDELCPLEQIIFEFMATAPGGVRKKVAIDHYVEEHPDAVSHYKHAVGGNNAGSRGLRPMATQVVGFTPILRRKTLKGKEVRGVYELIGTPRGKGRRQARASA